MTPISLDPPIVDVEALLRLDGKTALVTGASSGLGRRFAQVLDAAGARVVLVARRKENLEQLATTLGNALVIPADLAQPDSVDLIVAEVAQEWGSVDVLVNNAGIASVVPAVDEDAEAFRRALQINLEAPFHLAKGFATAAWAHDRSLSIINIASILGLSASRSMPQAGYTASKGALVNLTRELANQWARRSVRVNAIAPGWFPSEITAKKMLGTPEGVSFIRKNTPIGRVGQAHELDGALLFLASEASSYITGQVLAVDGGWTII